MGGAVCCFLDRNTCLERAAKQAELLSKVGSKGRREQQAAKGASGRRGRREQQAAKGASGGAPGAKGASASGTEGHLQDRGGKWPLVKQV